MGFLTDKPTSFTENSSGLIQPLKRLTDGRRHGGKKILSWNPKLHCIGCRAGTFEALAETTRRRRLLIYFARHQKRLRGKKRTFWIYESCHKPGAMVILQNTISKSQNFGETIFYLFAPIFLSGNPVLGFLSRTGANEGGADAADPRLILLLLPPPTMQ